MTSRFATLPWPRGVNSTKGTTSPPMFRNTVPWRTPLTDKTNVPVPKSSSKDATSPGWIRSSVRFSVS
eukprot:CAMPEP_0118994550 /NCGR_PEP_ID=MMETSP1173-20130426/56979_1 /TAXON_ID=1034831 /ORGANISM="Rhizochromulina marina cf, Strain CCMP1243" /LENGTH=67 /DNA_ID=CAMNT_0006945845 /DNA_START=72 /DNA_END=271 /DNA_ORIENTATION=-